MSSLWGFAIPGLNMMPPPTPVVSENTVKF